MSGQDERAAAVSRPTSVGVIGWFLIIIGMISFVASFWILANPIAKEAMRQSTISVPAQIVMMYVGVGITIWCAMAMLGGQNWGRYVYVISSVIGLVVGVLTSPMKAALIPDFIIFLVIAFFLFGRKANEYFLSDC